MSHIQEFQIRIKDFDLSLLPANARRIGSREFTDAVTVYFVRQLTEAGRHGVVGVDDEKILVTSWPEGEAPDPVEHAIDLLRSGDYSAGVSLLQSLRGQDPENPTILLNLGMAQSDMGRLDEAIHNLQAVCELEPENSSGRVALGVAQARKGEIEAARSTLKHAVAMDPENGYAQRNLAGILGKLGLWEDAEQHFRAAVRLLPADPAGLYGLAECLERTGGNERFAEADKLHERVIAMDRGGQIAELSKTARSRIAQKQFRDRATGTTRPDAVMYCLAALDRFEPMPTGDVRSIVLEIALLGRNGLDVNDPTKKYRLRALPGEFSGLELVACMYVGSKLIDPSLDVGFDLSKEFEAACSLRGRPD